LGNEIARGVSVAGGLVNIDSKINGDLKAAAGQILINSEITGNVMVQADEKLVIGENANIHGVVIYKGRKEADVAEGAQLANAVQFEKITDKAWKSADNKTVFRTIFGFMTIAFLVKLIILIVTALILLALLPKCTNTVVGMTLKNYWRNTLYGLIVFIMAPVIMILLLVTIIGSMAGAAVGLVYGLLILLSKVIASIIVGVWVMKLFNKKKDVKLDWKPVIIGAVVFDLLILIPILGWIAAGLVFLSAFGALSTHAYESIIKKQ
jgi:hypothetical protein